MGKKSTPESSHQPPRTLSRATLITAVFLGLHVLPLFWRPNSLWGVDFLFYLPTPIQGLFILLAVLLFVPGFRRQVRACAGGLPLALWGQGRRVWVSRTLVALIVLAAFVALSSARNFLGDGYRLMKAPEADKWTSLLRAPLTYGLIQTLHYVGSTFWMSVENTYRIYSYGSGVLYVLFAFPFAAVLGKNTLERSIVLAFLLTAGYTQLFFGYVENYAIYMPGLLLYIHTGLRASEDRMPLIVPALLLGVLLALHRGFFIFGPSLLFLAYRGYRNRQYSVPARKNALATAAALCCVPASAVLFLALSGVGVHEYLSRIGGSHFPSIVRPTGISSAIPHLLAHSHN